MKMAQASLPLLPRESPCRGAQVGAVGMHQVMLLKEQNQGWVLMQIPGSALLQRVFHLSSVTPVPPLVTWDSFGVAILAL